MNRLTILAFALILMPNLAAWAQNAHFLDKGKVLYEKRVNSHAIIREQAKGDDFGAAFSDMALSNTPQFAVTYYQLEFNSNTSLFQKDPNKKESRTSSMNFFMSSEDEGVAFKDLSKSELVQQRSVYGETILIQDSLPDILWRITDEYRDIAGYSCRRANGLIMDSIYVVAFYSDQILPSNGPESFGGLPGTILGLAIPEIHTTWFATAVQFQDQVNNLVAPTPRRAKTYTRKTLIETYSSRFRSGPNISLYNIIL